MDWQEFLHNATYFTSLEEAGYILGIIGLLLAIIQFGQQYIVPHLYKLLRRFKFFNKLEPNEVLKMLNRAMGLFGAFALMILPFIVIVFFAKLIMTITLFIGVSFDSWIAFAISAAVFFVIWIVYIRRLMKEVTDESIVYPKTETEQLSQDVRELAQSTNNLVQQMKATNQRLDRVVKVLEIKPETKKRRKK